MKKLTIFIFGIFLSFTIAFFGVKQATSTFNINGTNASELELSEDKFTVSFYDEKLPEGEPRLLYQKEFNVGEEVKYDGPEPYKEMTKEQTFVFDGWEDAEGSPVTLSEITENKDVYARYSAENNEYNIFYYLNGGSEDEEDPNPTSYDMTSGQITLKEPTKAEDTFLGWLGTDLTTVTKTVTFDASDLKNREYFAIYQNSEIVVHFVNNNLADYGTYYDDAEDKGKDFEVSFSDDFNFDGEAGTVTVEDKTYTATKPADSNAYSYEFVGLKYSFNDDDVPTITVTASYSRTVKTYTITYFGVEGASFSGVREYSIESSTISLTRPTKAGFTFTGWTGTDIVGDPVMDVTITISEENLKNREYTANFDTETYTLTIVVSTASTGYGTVDTETIPDLAYGTKVTYSSNKLFVGEGDGRQTVTATPSDQTDQYTYKFNYWSSVPNEIKKSTTVYANFYRESRKYNLYFDETLSVKTPEGENAHYGDSFAYDTELVVYFTESPNKHKTSLSCNGAEIDVTETDGGGYGSFKVTQTTYLYYSEDWDTFTVHFKANNDDAGQVDQTQVENVVYGTEVIVENNKLILRYLTSSTEITATAKDSSEQFNFVFSKWETNGVTTVTEETTFVAIFQNLLTEKKLEFPENVIVTSGEGDELVTHSSGDIVPFGTTITISYVETEHYHKTVFTVNGEEGTNGMTYEVTEDVEIIYNEEIDTFTVTYSDGVRLTRADSGRTIQNGSEVAYGSMLFADYELDPHTKCESFTLNGVEIEKGHEFMVDGEVNIVFVKVKDKIEIKLGETENGTFTLSTTSIEAGEEVEVFATPNEFFKVQEVYYITDNGEPIQIYNFKFVMPNEEITVYVKFEREYYVLADNLRGVMVAVKVDDVAEEPTLSVKAVTGEIANYANGLYNSTNIKIFEIKILVNGEEITALDHPAIIIFKLSEGQSAEKLQCLLISGESGAFTNQTLTLAVDANKGEARVTTSALGNFAFGEKQAQGSGSPNSTDSNQPKKTSTVLIVCLVTGAVLVATTVIIVVVLVKRNKNKK